LWKYIQYIVCAFQTVPETSCLKNEDMPQVNEEEEEEDIYLAQTV